MQKRFCLFLMKKFFYRPLHLYFFIILSTTLEKKNKKRCSIRFSVRATAAAVDPYMVAMKGSFTRSRVNELTSQSKFLAA